MEHYYQRRPITSPMPAQPAPTTDDSILSEFDHRRLMLLSSQEEGEVSQPSLLVIVSRLIVLIVRTPLLIAPSPVCALPPFVVTVTTPVLDPLLSSMDYCFPPLYCSICLVYFLLSLLSLCSYCSLSLIVLTFLLSSTSYCSLEFTALDGLTT